MKVSLSWLNEWVSNIPENIASRLTMVGLEVEAEESAAPYFTGVVVGEVKSLEQHPDADRLKVAQVDVGAKELVQIVCGAPNVSVGMKAPTAMVGAVLPGDFKIKATKLRGVPSNGMLCSADELGISDDSSGLLSLDSAFDNGADFRQLYDLDDQILDIDLTPNRGDCLSILGVARDVAAITDQDLNYKTLTTQPVTIDDQKSVSLEAKEECPRYLGRVIRNLNPSAKTPLWMSERLRRAGMRSNGILVDITNYVLLELGQPLHAFDLNAIEGDIHVRNAKAGEKLTLIGDNEVTLQDNTLLITDDAKILAMAGIMGGASSACNEKTTDIFLESAWFNEIKIAGKARNYGLHTDASHRYERGVDFNLAEEALERATALLIELANGEAGPITRAESEEHLPTRNTITIRYDRIHRLIGVEYSQERVKQLLSRVGTIVEEGDDYLRFKAPSYRFDLAIEEDLIEEVVRLDGYDNVPVSFASASVIQMPEVPESKVKLNDFKNILVTRDYHEIIAMSFVSPKWQTILDPKRTPIALKNPISNDLSVMRTTLLPGVLGAMEYNLKRQQDRIRFFETGLTYNGTLSDLTQERYIAGAICGERVPAQWGESATQVDFYDIKGDVEALLNRTEMEYRFEKSNHLILHPGQGADIYDKSGECIGYVGKLHPTISDQLDIKRDVYLFELNYGRLSRSKTPEFHELSRFPTSKRDLALVVPQSLSHQEIVDAIYECSDELLHDIQLFDIYNAEKSSDDDHKYMAYSLIFQSDKENLKDSTIDTIIESILEKLNSMNITLRQ